MMKSKNKILIIILVIGIILVGAWGIGKIHKVKKVALVVSEVRSLFPTLSEKIFTVGSLELHREDGFGKPTPKIKGEDIFHYFVKSDIFPIWVKMPPEKENLSFEDLAGRNFLFTGRTRLYDTIVLAKENPDIEWLKHISLGHLSVLEIEQMIPVEDDDSMLRLDVPETLSDEFEFSITIKNLLPIALTDAILAVNITPGPFRITAVEPSDAKIIGLSYYSKIIQEKYGAGREKKFNFKVKAHSLGFREKTNFEILVTFGGYGIKAGIFKSELIPAYSQEVQKYKFLWIKE